MDKSKSPPHSPRDRNIKIKLLDIFPSLSELNQQQEELDIIFQGLDIFYNLYELLENKTELTINIKNKKSIIISLIKSSNIFATCFYTIKSGEQWITFSYENKKKKETSFVQSLIDCIKIKLNCEFLQDKSVVGNNLIFNTKKINFNCNNKNNYLKQNSNYSSLTTEENFRTTNNKISKIFSNKGIKNISLECSPKEKFSEKAKYSYIKYEYSKNNKSNKDLNSLNKLKIKNSSNKITVDDLNLRVNKIIDVNNSNEESKLNLTQKTKRKNMSNNNLDLVKFSNKNINIFNKDNKLYNNFDFDINKKAKQIIKSKILNNNTFISELNLKRPKNQNKSKNKLEKSQENLESLFTSNSIIGSLTNRINKGSKKELKCTEKITTLKNAKTPVITKNNKFQNSNNNLKDKTSGSNNQHNFSEQFEQSSSNIENEIDNTNKDDNNISDNSINENNGYEKLKEDFILLYNDNYVRNVQEDLLKLEIELFVEKMAGLISAYHFEINEKKLKSKILEEKLKENVKNFFKIKKLCYKLRLISKKYRQANTNLNKNLKSIKFINDKEFESNKQEINLFNLLYPYEKKANQDINLTQDKIAKKQELHKIIKIILSKPNNRNIIQNNDTFNKYLKEQIDKEEINNIYHRQEKNLEYKYTKPKARTRLIPKLQQTKYNTRTLYNNNINFMNGNNHENENININLINDDKKDNLSEHNVNAHSSSYYSKKTFKSDVYNPNKTYSRKIAK